MPDRSLLHQTGSIEPHFNAQRQPEPDARCCPECCGLGRYLPTFSANYTVRCGTCGGAGWLKPEGRC